MQVSVESSSGIERTIRIGIPNENIDSEVKNRLADTAKKVRIDGFRPGKVPVREVKRRYGASIRQEVLGEILRNSLYEAIEQEDLKPVGMPSIESTDEGETTFEFTAKFEIMPEVTLGDFSQIELTEVSASIEDGDVDTVLESLRESRASFTEVEREAADGDQLKIDFIGTLNGEAFEGGTASDTDLVLGSNSMIPGFEEGLVGAKAGDERVLELTFPEDYHSEDLAGKATTFTITVKTVSERKVPSVDDGLMEAYGVEGKTIEEFREEVKGNMQKELDKVLQDNLKAQVYVGLLGTHEVDVPQAIVNNEIDQAKKRLVSQYGQDPSKIDLSQIPSEMFADKAKNNATLSLIFSEIVSSNELKADADRVRSTVESMASSYEDPEEVVNMIYANDEQLKQVEALVVEDQVVELIKEKAQVSSETKAFKEAMELPREMEQLMSSASDESVAEEAEA